MAAAMLSSKLVMPSALKVSPSPRSTRSSTGKIMAKVATEDLTAGQRYALSLPGISMPFPDMFDPLNLTRLATPDDIKRWRESELMHGRVAMLAALGFVVQEQLQDFPAFLNFDGSVTGPAIYHFQQIEEKRPLFWETLLIAIGLCESYRVAIGWATPTGSGFNQLADSYEPGNLGFDPLGLLNGKSEEEKKDMQTRELNNGRLAMMSIIAFWIRELVPPHRTIFEGLARTTAEEAAQQIDSISGGL